MKKQKTVRVKVHVHGEPEEEFHEYILSLYEAALLQGLVGVPFPGVQITQGVREARKFNQGLEKANGYSFLKALIAKKLVVQKRRLASL